jgi:hypothetical protein
MRVFAYQFVSKLSERHSEMAFLKSSSFSNSTLVDIFEDESAVWNCPYQAYYVLVIEKQRFLGSYFKACFQLC